MKILVLDIETTGLDPLSSKIVEIGIVELDLTSGSILPVFESLCHERPISAEEVSRSWIVQNGYISLDEIRYSPEFNSIKPQIQGIIDCHPAGCTAYNSNFDLSFLITRGIKLVKALPDPMKLSTDICKLPGKYGYKWPKAEEAYNFFFPNSNYKESHRGLDDAIHEAEIIYKLYEIGVFTLI